MMPTVAAAVQVFEIESRGPGISMLCRNQRHYLVVDLFQDLVGKVNFLSFPMIGADRHIFDEAHL